MTILTLGFLALGLLIGSFLNVLIYRLNTEGAPSPLSGRSFCPHCHHPLSAIDLIPVVSFFSLSGRCRYCHLPISWQYPLVEIATGLIFLAVVITHPEPTLTTVLDLAFACALIVIFGSDYIYGLIPDEMVEVIAAIGLIRLLLGLSGPLLSVLASGLIPAGILAGLILVSRGRALGWGDVKLVLALGWVLGFPAVLIFLWLSFILGGLFALGLLVLKQKSFGETIALGPFLVIGGALTYFYGQALAAMLTGVYPY